MTVSPEQVVEAAGDNLGLDQIPQVDQSSKPASRGRLILRRFLRNKVAVGSLVLLAFLFLWAFVGPYFYKWNYTTIDFNAFLKPPSANHWFGTTTAGLDVYARTLRGMQKSLIIGLLVGAISTSVAAMVGASAAYFGGITDRVLMWIVDLLLVLPSFLIIAILSPTFKNSTWLIFVVLLAAFNWMITARSIRGMTQSLREREYVMAARYMGVRPMRIILRHILPNIASFIIIDATLNVGNAILAEAGLSFFGFGVQPPDVSLGTLINEGQDSATTYPWLFAFCGGLLVLIIACVLFIGDGLRDAFDPNTQSNRAR